jgi:hypothetical protein
MSVRITLTDVQLPPSQAFLEFLDLWLAKVPFDGSNWAVYGKERAARIGGDLSRSSLVERSLRIGESKEGMRHLARAYELFVALMIGDVDTIHAFQSQFRFVVVVGVPRSGGKYLTKELFRALGHAPERVPALLAHDGFPEADPWRFDETGNSWMDSLQTMAEYVTMVELFFGQDERRAGQVVVPKKATKAVYAAGLYESVLGRSAEGIVTLRHPVPACISTYEAAGGLPRDGRFVQRGATERWCARDLIGAGFDPGEIAEMEYFDAYLRYWEQYHLRLAMSGPNLTRKYRVVAYGAERFMEEARWWAAHYGSSTSPVETFNVQDRHNRHPEWMHRAEAPLRRIADHWASVGLEFPLAEVAEAW